MNIVIGIVIIFVFEELVNYVFKHTKYYHNYLNDVSKFVKGVPENIEIACVGSGPGYYGISFEDSELKGFNFCTAPQNFEYAYRILQKYKDKLKKNCIVIITIMCPMSFGMNNAINNRNYSDKYYYFLDKKDIDNYSLFKAFILKRPLFVFGGRFIKRIKNALKSRISKECNNNKISVADSWMKQFHLQDLKSPKQAKAHERCFAKKRELLCEEIKFLKQNGLKPVLVILPVPKVTRDEISEEFIQEFSKKNVELVVEQMSVPVIDYYSDERITEDMYRNDIFLNEKGKKFFSDILLSDVKKLFDL